MERGRGIGRVVAITAWRRDTALGMASGVERPWRFRPSHEQNQAKRLGRRQGRRWLWLGLALVAVAWPLAWFGPAPFSEHTFFPLWLGYILTVDGLTSWRGGDSLLARDPRRFALLFVFSIPLWWLFEFANRFLGNWRYLTPRDHGPVAYAAARLARLLDGDAGALRHRQLVAHRAVLRPAAALAGGSHPSPAGLVAIAAARAGDVRRRRSSCRARRSRSSGSASSSASIR